MEPTANAHWHHPSQIQQTQGYHPHPVSQTNQGPSPAGSNLPPTTSAPRSFIPTNESPLAPAEALFKNAWQTAQRQVNDEISKLNGELAATHSELRASTKNATNSASTETRSPSSVTSLKHSSHNSNLATTSFAGRSFPLERRARNYGRIIGCSAPRTRNTRPR